MTPAEIVQKGKNMEHEGELNLNRLMPVLSQIRSRQLGYEVEITIVGKVGDKEAHGQLLTSGANG